jgi:hypothetical protein
MSQRMAVRNRKRSLDWAINCPALILHPSSFRSLPAVGAGLDMALGGKDPQTGRKIDSARQF